jgi:hypothetical protein
MSGLPKWNKVVRTSTGPVMDGSGRLMAVLIDSEHADFDLDFVNDTTGAGANVLKLGGEAEDATQRYFDFSRIGGVYFSTACWMKLAATGATVHCWVDGTPSTAFDPGDVAGLWLWLDAPQLRLTADAAIATWNDLSGNGRNFVQATAARKPTYKTSIQNGLAIARFDGGDMVASAAVQSLTQPCTMFFVASRTGNTSAYNILLTEATSEQIAAGFNTTANNWYIYTQPDAPDTQAAADSAFHVLTAQFNGTSSLMRADGTQVAKSMTDQDVSADTFNIGATNALGAPLAGDIGEILIYEAALSAANIALVEDFLADKWGVTLA